MHFSCHDTLLLCFVLMMKGSWHVNVAVCETCYLWLFFFLMLLMWSLIFIYRMITCGVHVIVAVLFYQTWSDHKITEKALEKALKKKKKEEEKRRGEKMCRNLGTGKNSTLGIFLEQSNQKWVFHFFMMMASAEYCHTHMYRFGNFFSFFSFDAAAMEL